MTFDPFDIDDCRDASSIRARIKLLGDMSGNFFDGKSKIGDTIRELEGRLKALGEEV